MAASEAAKEAVHLSHLATELGLSDLESDPMELFMDNQSGIDVAYNPEHHTRMKHVARRHFYVRELVEEGVLRVSFVGTADNWADFFTKPLQGQHFFRMRAVIMNEAPSATGGRRGKPST